MNVCHGTLTQCSSVYLRVGERALDVNDQRWQEQKHRDGDPAGTIRASESLLQEYSQMREAAEIPTYRKSGARGRRDSGAPPATSHASRHAIAATNQAVQRREITPSVLAHERYHAVQRRDRELVVAQDVVVRMLRPHADARREV